MKMTCKEQAEAHYIGKPHARKLTVRLIRDEMYAKIDPDVLKSNLYKDGSKFHCTLCDMSLSSEHIMLSHFTGKKHQARANNDGTTPKEGETEKKEKKEKKEKTPKSTNGAGPTVQMQEHPLATAVDMEIDTFQCELCRVSLSTQALLDGHLAGKKHKARMNATEEKGNFYCEVCNVSTTDQVALEKHIAGKKHKAVLNRQVQGKMTAAPVKVAKAPAVVGPGQQQFFCATCNISMTCQDHLDAHMNGNKHLAVVRMQERDGFMN